VSPLGPPTGAKSQATGVDPLTVPAEGVAAPAGLGPDRPAAVARASRRTGTRIRSRRPPPAPARRRALIASLPWSTVTATVEGGIVHLEGEVPYRSDAMVLEALVHAVDGVVEIDNRLEWVSADIAAPSILDAPGVPAPAAR
jgi:BON domain